MNRLLRISLLFVMCCANVFGQAFGRFPSLADRDLERGFEQSIAWVRDEDRVRSPGALEWGRQALDWARRTRQPLPRMVNILVLTGDASFFRGQLPEAEALFNEANELLRQSPDQAARWYPLHSLLSSRFIRGDCGGCAPLARELMELADTLLPRDIADALRNSQGAATSDDLGNPRSASGLYDRVSRMVRPDLEIVANVLLQENAFDNQAAAFAMIRKAIPQDLSVGQRASGSGPLTQAPNSPLQIPIEPGEKPLTAAGAFARLKTIADLMGRLTYGSPTRVNVLTWKNPRQLQQERAVLEGAIFAPPEFTPSNAFIRQISETLPRDSALIDYVLYDRLVVTRPNGAIVPAATRVPSYLGVMVKGGRSTIRDLGPAATIDAQVVNVCRSLVREFVWAGSERNCTAKDVAAPTDLPTRDVLLRDLHDRLLGPFAKELGPADEMIVVPDGALSFLPFEILLSAPGRPLIADHVVSYVSSSRELLRWRDTAAASGESVLLGDPAFAGATEVACDEPRNRVPVQFSRLCGTRAEIERIKEALPKARVIEGAEATEEAVKALQSPHVLHLATHGFALPRADIPMSKPPNYNGWTIPEWDALVADPMLRSGIALSGANRRQSPGGTDDGILTAGEVTLMNLSGTRLVVISACDSGMGDARAGEGVIGFRRAFALAGAKAQTYSLWRIQDSDGQDFMRRYYRLLESGMRNAQALATVKRELIAEKADAATWATFVTYGDPGPITR